MDNLEKVKEILLEALDALRWCSGSADFNEGGIARIGWVKGPQKALEHLTAALESIESQPKEGNLRLKGYHDVEKFYKEKPLCCYCKVEADGPMLVMGAEMAHSACVQKKLAELLDPDFEQPKAEPQPDEGRLLSPEEKAIAFADAPYLDLSFEDDYRDEVAVLLEAQLAKDMEHEQTVLKQVFEDIGQLCYICPTGTFGELQAHKLAGDPVFEALKQKYLGKEEKDEDSA